MKQEEDKREFLRHYYLYAKLHYHRSKDVIEDLKKIHSNTYEYDVQYVSVEDIKRALLSLIYKHYFSRENAEYFFTDMFRDIHPERKWLWFQNDEPWDIDRALIHKCLSMICQVPVLDDKKKTILELGDPDFTILPKKFKGEL